MGSKYVPTRKVTGVGVSGALSIIIVWGMSLGGLETPPEVGAAIAVVISSFTGYFLKDRKGESDDDHAAPSIPRQVE